MGVPFPLDALYRRIRVIILALETPMLLPPPPGLEFVARTGSVADEVLRAAMEEAGHWDEAELRERGRLGDACHMALDRGRCVHYCWASRRLLRVSEVGFEAPLDGGDVWIYNAYTSPSHRGRSIFPHVLAGIAREAAGAGGVAWAGVLEDNLASRRGIAKAGFAEAVRLEADVLLSAVRLGTRQTVLDPRLGARFP